MTIRHQIEVESVTFLFLAGAVGVVFAFYTGYKPNLQNAFSLPVIENLQSPIPTSVPNPQVTSQLSPDGKKQLTMKITTNEDLSKTYVFTTSNPDGTSQQTIYSATYTGDSMAIPFNTWSPDNKYVFITHNNPSGKEAIILKANGEAITEQESSINATKLFTTKITDNLYDEATGWASETLLLINTKTVEGKKSTSYWFEVPTKAIISLSTQF
jgi:hypothetical protein